MHTCTVYMYLVQLLLCLLIVMIILLHQVAKTRSMSGWAIFESSDRGRGALCDNPITAAVTTGHL